MFGLPAWLVTLVFNLVVTWGIPVVQKLLPSIPVEVWAAVKELLSHFHSNQNDKPDVTSEKATQLRTAVNKITRAKKTA